MKNNIGYDRAISMGKEQLAEKDPAEVVANTGVFWTGKGYEIPWFNKRIPLEEGAIEEQILWYHYMLAHGSKVAKGVYINYKQVPGAAIYNDNFIKRAISPMVKTFNKDLDDFLRRGQTLGAEKANLGHMAFTVKALPYVPLTYVIWQGDDEIPAQGNILFDETAIDWFCAEDLVVIASLPVYMMMKS